MEKIIEYVKWVYEHPEVTFSGIGLYIFGAITAIYLYIKNKILDNKNVFGCWEYFVHEANGKFSHKGYCNIRMNENRLQINGERLYTCSLNHECEKTNIAWQSTWADICHDDCIRFDYKITLSEGILSAICRINLSEKKPTEMTGRYYLLPPFNLDVLNCKYGTIKFKKILNPHEVGPPTMLEINNRITY